MKPEKSIFKIDQGISPEERRLKIRAYELKKSAKNARNPAIKQMALSEIKEIEAKIRKINTQ